MSIFKRFLIFCLLVLSVSVEIYADSEKDVFSLAKNAYEQTLYPTSYKLFENFLLSYPDSLKIGEAQLYSAKSLYKNKDYELAQKHFLKLLERDDPFLSQQAYYYLAMLYSLQGQADRFEFYLKKALAEEYTIFPYYYHAVFELADLLSRTGKIDEGIAFYSKILQYCEERQVRTNTYLKLSQIYLRQHDPEMLGETIAKWTGDSTAFEEPAHSYFYKAELAKLVGDLDNVQHLYARSLLFTNAVHVKDEVLSALILFLYQNDARNDAEEFILELSTATYKSYIKAWDAYFNGNYIDAVVFAESFLSNKSDQRSSRQAEVLLADSLYYSGRINDSSRHYKNFLEKFDNDIKLVERAHYGLGLCYLKKKRSEDAVKEFENISSSARNVALRMASYLHVAAGSYQRGRIEEALGIYNDILENFPSGDYADYALLRLVQINVETQNYQDAISFSERFDVEYTQSRLKEDNLYLRAYAYFMLEEYSLARENLLSFESLYPQSDTLSSVAALLLRVYSQTNELSEAKQLIEKYEKIFVEAKESEFLKEQALYYLEIGEFTLAISSFKRILVQNIDEAQVPEVLFYLASAYQQSGNFIESKKLYEKIISRYPVVDNIVQIRFNIADIYLESGNFEEAEEILLKNIESTDKKIVFQAMEYLCQLYLSNDDFYRAEIILDKVMLRFPIHSAELLAKKAKIFIQKGDFVNAEKFYSLAMDNGINTEEVHFNYAFALEKNGKSKLALEKYRDLIYVYAQGTEFIVKSNLRMASVYMQLNDLSKAKEIYQRVVELKVPESGFAQECLNKL